MQPDDRIQRLENNTKLLEQEKAGESCVNALAALRRHLNRPPSFFDPFEAIELMVTLVRLPRTQAHGKADEYAAALEEVKTRQPTLHSTHLQRLMLGLMGDPLRAKVAKEATSILKRMSRRLPRVPKQGDRCAAPLHTRFSVTLVRSAGTLHVIGSSDVVATLHVGANNCIWIFAIQGIVRSVSNKFPLFVKTCLFYFVLGWDLCPCPVDLGGPFQCLNFGPSSEPGVNKGLGSLFSFFGCLFQLVFLSFSFCFRQIIPCSPRDSVQPSDISL